MLMEDENMKALGLPKGGPEGAKEALGLPKGGSRNQANFIKSSKKHGKMCKT